MNHERPLARFQNDHELDPEAVVPLDEDHPALAEAHTIFPKSVMDPNESPRLLVSGYNNPKLGMKVTKGAWKGKPIFHLSLEERATCPRSCEHWATCYGNAMPFARRHAHGADLIKHLGFELIALGALHWEKGFVVRLHTLGDFYSVDYVAKWAAWLKQFPGLHVFGYTAWPPDSEIGAAIKRLRDARWTRFAIRFSSIETRTLWTKPRGDTVERGILCPAQTQKSECCGSCGLCWSTAARQKTIVFVAHGMKRRARPRRRKDLWPGRKEKILQIVRELHGHVSNQELCDRMGLKSCSSVSALIKRLAAEGVIKLYHQGRNARFIEIVGEAPPPIPKPNRALPSAAKPKPPPPPAPKFRVIFEPDPLPAGDRPTLMQLERHHCRYPMGGRGAAIVFCGAKATRVDSPYCPGHHDVCYLDDKPKTRKARNHERSRYTAGF